MGDAGQYGFDPNSLGGSLMKDLLADLKLDDDDWLSLAQLEKDLQDMESDGPRNQNSLPAAPPTTAASLVVASQPVTALPQPPPQQVVEPSAALDAWSISLQNFASSSLEKDFLQADSARKEEKKKQHSRPPPGLPQLEEYDVTSTPSAPPGLAPPPAASNDELANELAKKLEQELRSPPPMQHPAPPRPPPPQGAFIPPAPPQPMPPHLVGSPPPYGVQSPVMPAGYVPPPSHLARAGVATPPPFKTMVPPTPVSTPQTSFGVLPPQQQRNPSPLVMQPAATAPQVSVVRGPAWQTPPPAPQQPRIFANPHPTAPPVPAAGIASRLMPARDICYVVHSILRVILSAEPKEFPEYHVQYWTRHLPAASSATATPRKDNRSNSNADEIASRQARAKMWSTERKVLGATTKQAVTRPRALIAAPTSSKSDASDDRAALWKARICCDQGWQNLLANTPASRIKLFKCLGVTATAEGTTSIDEQRLRLVLQLPKGQTLWARTLEQYGMPSAVALPATLRIVWEDSSNNNNADRLWTAWGTVIRRQALDEDRLLESIRVVMEHPTPAFATTASMTLTHTLLETAQHMAGTNESFRERWKPTEEQFMHLLSGL